MLLTAGNHDLERQSVRIDNGVDFGCQPSTRTTKAFAGIIPDATCVLMGADYRAVDAPRHRHDVRWQSGYDPKRLRDANARSDCSRWCMGQKCSGRSRQGPPDLKIQKMPFRTCLSSARGTPRGLQGSIGAISRHSTSERACLMFKAPFSSLNHASMPNFSVCFAPDIAAWSVRSIDRLEPKADIRFVGWRRPK